MNTSNLFNLKFNGNKNITGVSHRDRERSGLNAQGFSLRNVLHNMNLNSFPQEDDTQYYGDPGTSFNTQEIMSSVYKYFHRNNPSTSNSNVVPTNTLQEEDPIYSLYSTGIESPTLWQDSNQNSLFDEDEEYRKWLEGI